MSTETLPSLPTRDARVITLIGFAHGVSHFFHLLLPPLFPWLMTEYGLDYTGIGGTMTVFFAVSGVGQALAGFLVDRFGPVRVLLAGMMCFVLAALLLALVPGVWVLFAAAALAGMGNAVFHPSDFTVLNRRVSAPRLGHAFSVHGLSGNLGWAAAPVFFTGLTSLYDWRTAALLAALVPLPAMLWLWADRALLEGEHTLAGTPKTGAGGASFLTSLPVWLCFTFFFLVTIAFGTMQNYGPSVLEHLYGLSRAVAATSLSGYMLAGAGGIVLGGFIAQRSAHDWQIAAALSLAALCAVLLATQWAPAWGIPALMAGIGFFTGIAGPSRDLLVRRAATARFGQAAYGRVYGFVYSGLDLGLALAPLLFGLLMDQGRFAAVLAGVALFQGLAVLAALRVGKMACGGSG